MKATLISLVFAASALAQTSNFMLNTPSNVQQCLPLQLTWQNGQQPFFLTVTPGATPSGPPLVNLGQVNGTSFTWSKVNIQANTQIGFSLRDSTGALAQTAAVTVNDSGDSSCLGQQPSGSAGTAAPPAGATTGGATTGGATTGAGATTPAGSSPTGSSPTKPATSAGNSASTTKTGASSASSTNAASANVVQTGAAGIIGAALLALLA